MSDGQLAYIGPRGGKYLPFSFERTINMADIEISEEVFIVSKEIAEAYETEGQLGDGNRHRREDRVIRIVKEVV